MGIAIIPAGSTGISTVIRSIQRGTAASAGNITISSVDTTKTIVNSFSTTSSGTIAATGTVSAATGTVPTASGANTANPNGTRYNPYVAPAGTTFNSTASRAISLNATNLSGGSTNLVAGVNGAYLSNSTTLVATGPCRYEVIEYI